MGREVKRMSALTVAALTTPGYHPDGAGLYLQVSPTGTKSWVFRFKVAGRAREMGLGSLQVVSLARARKDAQACREMLHDGIDPIEERDGRRAKARDRALFRDCALDCIEAHRAGWSNAKHAAQWTSTLTTYAFPILGSMPVDAIEPSHVERVLTPIWTKKPETASRVRMRIEAVLDWAKARNLRSGDNPATWRGNLDNLLPKLSRVQTVTHFAALPFAEIGGFVAELRKADGVGAIALEFAILTAARTGEVIGAQWDEFDLKAGVWTVPAERMKAKVQHRVPLSDRAKAIIEQMSKAKLGAYVFPGLKANRPLSNMALLAVLRRMDRQDLTVHGFRSTFRDWASETTAYPRDVVEMALAHTIKDSTEAAYRRGDLLDKRRPLMNDWARRCATTADSAKVLPMRKMAKQSNTAA
jgi:integrase